MKKIARLVAVLLCVCTMFTSCAPVGTSGEKTADSEYSQEVQNLEKLCKVWGYIKYNHPAFLLGQKDWDEELLNLIPVVSEAKENEVNNILHEWFVSFIVWLSLFYPIPKLKLTYPFYLHSLWS